MQPYNLSLKLAATSLHEGSRHSLMSPTSQAISATSWNQEKLIELDDPAIENYLQPHEVTWKQNPECLTTNMLAAECDKELEDPAF